jgi:hypothetical protein
MHYLSLAVTIVKPSQNPCSAPEPSYKRCRPYIRSFQRR